MAVDPDILLACSALPTCGRNLLFIWQNLHPTAFLTHLQLVYGRFTGR